MDAYAGIQLRERFYESSDLGGFATACRVRYLRAGVVGLDIACEVVAGHDVRRSPAAQPTAHGADAHLSPTGDTPASLLRGSRMPLAEAGRIGQARQVRRGNSAGPYRLLSGANDLPRAKLGANVSRSRAVSDVVRRLSLQVSATRGGGGRCLAWLGSAS